MGHQRLLFASCRVNVLAVTHTARPTDVMAASRAERAAAVIVLLCDSGRSHRQHISTPSQQQLGSGELCILQCPLGSAANYTVLPRFTSCSRRTPAESQRSGRTSKLGCTRPTLTVRSNDAEAKVLVSLGLNTTCKPRRHRQRLGHACSYGCARRSHTSSARGLVRWRSATITQVLTHACVPWHASAGSRFTQQN